MKLKVNFCIKKFLLKQYKASIVVTYMTSCNNFHSFFMIFMSFMMTITYYYILSHYYNISFLYSLLYFRFFSFDIFFFCGKMCYYYCYKLCRLLGIMNVVYVSGRSGALNTIPVSFSFPIENQYVCMKPYIKTLYIFRLLACIVVSNAFYHKF